MTWLLPDDAHICWVYNLNLTTVMIKTRFMNFLDNGCDKDSLHEFPGQRLRLRLASWISCFKVVHFSLATTPMTSWSAFSSCLALPAKIPGPESPNCRTTSSSLFTPPTHPSLRYPFFWFWLLRDQVNVWLSFRNEDREKRWDWTFTSSFSGASKANEEMAINESD